MDIREEFRKLAMSGEISDHKIFTLITECKETDMREYLRLAYLMFLKGSFGRIIQKENIDNVFNTPISDIIEWIRNETKCDTVSDVESATSTIDDVLFDDLFMTLVTATCISYEEIYKMAFEKKNFNGLFSILSKDEKEKSLNCVMKS
jgi:hypothetical protein